MEAVAPRRPGPVRVAFVLLHIVAAGWVLSVFVRAPGMDAYDKARFGDSIHSRAWRPFVGRVLVPWTVQGILAPVPARAREAAAEFIRPALRLEYARDYPLEFALTAALLLGALVGFALALRRLAAVTLGLEGWRLDVIPVLALLFLPTMFVYHNYVYDPAGLLLFTLGLAMIAERREAGYYVAFALATLNKETSILLTLVWLLHLGRELPRGKLFFGLAVQLLGWLAVRGGIALLYRHQPGVMLEWWHLSQNLALPTRIARQLATRPLGRIVAERGVNALALPVAAAVIASLRRAPVFLKRAFWIALPLGATMLVFGFLEEFRALYELYPVAVLVLASGVMAVLRPRRGGVSAG
ncbi:MAG: hypothetical protein R6X12_09940 [bacterium]